MAIKQKKLTAINNSSQLRGPKTEYIVFDVLAGKVTFKEPILFKGKMSDNDPSGRITAVIPVFATRIIGMPNSIALILA